MEILTASTLLALDAAALPLLAEFLGNALNILWVAVGLGLVIFFHELGHFAVAKWCNVNVERFSIGFGPILWSFKKGETEYALSAIPFGGYVKMLGQDDMDPSQLSSEEIARDPRSYSAKPVRQRMAIISAGVVMNIITAMLFFAIAFSLGVDMPPAELGGVQTGKPAWVHGIEFGDRITRINDREIEAFPDIMRAVALTTGPVTVEGVRRDGRTTFEMTFEPDESDTRRLIGAGLQVESLMVLMPGKEKLPTVWPGTPAAAAGQPFEPGDRIEQVDEERVAAIAGLQEYMARYDVRARPVTFGIRRAGQPSDQLTEITVAPQRFRTLGLRLQMGRIEAVQIDSPAAAAGLQKGDKITHVDGQVVGTELDPMELPDYLGRRAGQPVELTVIKDKESREVSLSLTPRDKAGWMDQPVGENVPLAATSIGIAYYVVPTVQDVRPESPAAQAGIRPGERIRLVEFLRPKGADEDFISAAFDDDKLKVELKNDNGETFENWPHAFWLMQMAPTRTIILHLSDKDGKPRNVTLAPVDVDRDWFYPRMRGLRLHPLLELQQAENVLAATGMGVRYTKNWAIDIYLTLRNLLTGRISPKELHGPVGIAKVAYKFAEQGLADLLLFLGILSVNLAVLNFLPIPVLDGGHMVFLIWEGVTRKKPNEKILVAATYAGFAFVVGLMLAVLYLDIFVHGAAGR
ncbi:MAG TPA: RIP metalloprotease RseP [Planctomycetaceae bacterium]|nr:RIP metalloprotease RseP [Planctomycetaceae bacterium]